MAKIWSGQNGIACSGYSYFSWPSTGKLQDKLESSEGLFTHVAGGWCWLLVENLAGGNWLIQVAWAFSQHAGWADRTSIPRRERQR